MRLTNNLRYEIRNNIVDGVMKSRRDTLKHLEGILADAIYKESFDRNVIQAVSKLPLEWQTRASSIGISYFLSAEGERKDTVSFRFAGEDKRPIPNSYTHKNTFLEIRPSHPLAARVVEYQSMRTKFYDDEGALRERLDGLLASFTTIERFIKDAPEWEEYVPKTALVGTTKNLPAVQMASIHSFIEEISK